MKKSNSIAILSFVLLTLMFCKVSAFHVYSHDDGSSAEIENCLQCDLAIENQVSEFETVSVFSFEAASVDVDTRIVFLTYHAAVELSPLRFKQFGRPPPVTA